MEEGLPPLDAERVEERAALRMEPTSSKQHPLKPEDGAASSETAGVKDAATTRARRGDAEADRDAAAKATAAGPARSAADAALSEEAWRQAAAVLGLRVQGHPIAGFNGIYTPVSVEEGGSRAGFPHYELGFCRPGGGYDDPTEGKNFLFHNAPSKRWLFGGPTHDSAGRPTPGLMAELATTMIEDRVRSRVSIGAQDGTVPIGEHTWDRRGKKNHSITVTELKTEAEVVEHAALVAEERARCSLWPYYLLCVVVRSSHFAAYTDRAMEVTHIVAVRCVVRRGRQWQGSCSSTCLRAGMGSRTPCGFSGLP